MIDYKKVETARKLLEESGVPYILAYANSDEKVSTQLNGKYLKIKDFITTIMLETFEDVHSQCGSGMAAGEVFSIASTVLEWVRAKAEGEEQ